MEFDPATADPATLAQLVAGIGVAVLCLGGGLFLAGLGLVGMAMLRREGQSEVTVRRAVRRGAKTMTLFFERKEGVDEPWTDAGTTPEDE